MAPLLPCRLLTYVYDLYCISAIFKQKAGTMRYHLNVRDGAELIQNKEGGEFATLKAACAEARASVQDLATEDIRSGRPAHEWRVEIANRDGAVLGTVGVSFFAN